MSDRDLAEQFLAANARVLDLRRYDRLCRGGESGPVRDAIAAYRNADGGLGHGLEPDGRCPGSQPAAISLGLRHLHEADAWDDELVAGILGWLTANEPAEGGVTFVVGDIEGWPHAPWWQPLPGLAASLAITGPIASVLLHRGVAHPWLDRAVDWLRETAPSATGHYDLLGALAFAEHVPGLAEKLAPAVAADTEEDPLAAGQQPDGGWTFNWLAWNDAATADWRGSLTVDALAR